MDDFTAWVTGPTAQSNREGIEAIIKDAIDWEKRSGATFEADKTAVIHFTRKAYKTDTQPFTIKEQEVKPKDHVKVLGVVMDAGLKFREHIARAASKGLEAVLELRRLKGLSPPTARQLFTATVAPVMDYASNVWMHACQYRTASPVQRVQRIGAQAVVGTFMSVATCVAEAEAHIRSAQDEILEEGDQDVDRHAHPTRHPPSPQEHSRNSQTQTTTSLALLPSSGGAEGRTHGTPRDHSTLHVSALGKRVRQLADEGTETTQLETGCAVRIAVGSSARNGVVGIGGAMETKWTTERRHKSGPCPPPWVSIRAQPALRGAGSDSERLTTYRGLVPPTWQWTRNKAVALTLARPHQQSGQQHCRIYDAIKTLKRNGNSFTVIWIPTGEENELLNLAKEMAKAASRQGAVPQKTIPKVRSTTLNEARRKRGIARDCRKKSENTPKDRHSTTRQAHTTAL